MARGKAHSIVGSSNHRKDSDYYITPAYATEALFRVETFQGLVWEPACGDGSMSKVIEKYNKCFSSDIREDVYSHGGIDFLSDLQILEPIPNIITNPPYKYARKFVEKAKSIAVYKVAMLLKLVFLEGSTRYDMFHDTAFPLKKVYVFSSRVTMYGTAGTTGGTGMLAFAWFVWDKQYVGQPSIDWLKDTM